MAKQQSRDSGVSGDLSSNAARCRRAAYGVGGATGGYALAKPPEAISLAEVMEVLEGPTQVQSNIAIQTPATRALQSVWNEVADTQRTMLESTTFADLAERLRQPAEEMWHI